MADQPTIEELTPIIHHEVAKYIDQDFSDGDNLVTEVGLVSDDLSAIALTLERRFRVKVDRKLYRDIHSVDDFARVLHGAIAR